jgi:type I site-specific restriction-modification system R (restriction) subunit
LLGRSSDGEVVLTRSLRAKLRELNPGLPDAAYDDAVRQVTTTVTAQTLIATNREKFKDDEITRRVFGRYVSVYDFQRAVEDQATVPLYYDTGGEKLGVAIGDLNERIAAKLAELEDEYRDDINVRKRLEQELKRDYHVITAEKRLAQVARDFVQHYSTAWESGKAMFVCIDKLTCVKMHGLITKFWDERIAGLEAELQAMLPVSPTRDSTSSALLPVSPTRDSTSPAMLPASPTRDSTSPAMLPVSPTRDSTSPAMLPVSPTREQRLPQCCPCLRRGNNVFRNADRVSDAGTTV